MTDVIDFEAWLKSEGHFSIVMRPDQNLWYGVKRLLFHYTLVEGEIGDRECYRQRWCYRTAVQAVVALHDWSDSEFATKEPEGWHRHPSTGRRRDDGDPAKEYIAW